MCSEIFEQSIFIEHFILNQINTFKFIIMENKELRNSLITIMKEEIAQLANEQKEQKKTRKLANRPEGKSLQSIVDEISKRKDKITHLIWIYRFIRHGRKYWENRDRYSWEEYFYNKPENNHYYWDHRNEPGCINRAKKYCIGLYDDYMDKLNDKYHFYEDDSFIYEDFIEYLFWEK